MNINLAQPKISLPRPFRFRAKAAAFAFSATLLVLASSTGCSRQGFQVTESTVDQLSPGSFYIPPKVDIILAEDDTGSRAEVNSQLAGQIRGFLTDLESRGWNYHFATTGLTTPTYMDQALASKHDGNWGSQWRPAYPGAPQFGPDTLSGVFRTPENYTRFVQPGGISNGGNGIEDGFETIRAALYENYVPSSNFIRQDALLVVIVISNGNDTSGVNMCQLWGNGPTVPCEQVTSDPQIPRTSESSFQNYRSAFLARKNNNTAAIHFYAAVSTAQGNSSHPCLSSYAYPGRRYSRMASELAGDSFDICSQPVSNILGSVAQHLQGIRIAQRTRYLFVPIDVEPSSLRVRKYLTNGSVVDIPNDATNGFTYSGYVNNVYAIDYPVAMNLASGYAIELHGSAKLVGDERADVTYIPRGAHDTTN